MTGERWSRAMFAPVEDQGGVFGEIKPQPWGKPWRPSRGAVPPGSGGAAPAPTPSP